MTSGQRMLLKLDRNEQTTTWCLERLGKDCSRRTKTLAIFQSTTLYYSALAVKRTSKMRAADRNKMAAATYEFAGGSYLRWLSEEFNFQAPAWLTHEAMGQRTLAGENASYR